MINQFKIVTKNDLEMYSESQNIIGTVYFEVEDFFFPMKDWSDFVVIILTWWMEEIDKTIQAKVNTKFKFFFMDGPYYINAIKIEQGTLEFQFVGHDTVVFSNQISINNLITCLLQASKSTLKLINQNGWDTEDINKFKVRYGALKSRSKLL